MTEQDIPRFIIIRDAEVQGGTFSVAYTKNIAQNREVPIALDNLEFIFWGDQSGGSALFGFTYIVKAIEAGQQVVLLMRDGDPEPVFPQKIYSNGTRGE